MRQKKFTAWSFSRYADYLQCPRRAKYKHLDKLPEPSGPALERGARIHDEAAAYLLGSAGKLPPDLELVRTLVNRARLERKRRPTAVAVEESWAFTGTWGRTTWDDWTGCVVRIKLDLALVSVGDEPRVEVIDWKTGKPPRPELKQLYLEQLQLYALGALLTYPHASEVEPRLVYTDSGGVFPPPEERMSFVRADQETLKKLWAGRTKKLLADTTFTPRPSDRCRWCYYRKGNGGPCRY